MAQETKYSYSKIDTYDQCPFKYYLKYVEKHYPKTGSVALEFGSAVHKVEEDIGNYLKEGKDIPYQDLITNFLQKCTEIEKRYPKDFAEKDKSGRTYAEKIDYYVNTGIYRFEKYLKANPDLELLGTEIGFTFRFNGKELFKGSIDRALRNNITGEYIVQDIKTYAVPLKDNGPGDRDEHLITPLQFVTYCLAMSEMYPVDPTTIKCQYDLPLCDIVQDAGTKGFIGRGRTKVSKIFDKINEEDWQPKQSQLCHWCEYCMTNDSADVETKFLCPYFMKWTKENKTFEKENDWPKANIGEPALSKEEIMRRHKNILEAYYLANGIKNK